MAVARERAEITVKNKATDQEIGRVPRMSEADARAAVERARAAQPAWGALALEERVRILLRFRDLLVDSTQEIAQLLSMENGKTIQETITAEILPLTDLTTYFAKHAREILAPKPIKMHLLKHRASYLHYRARGVVLVISPWNFPLVIGDGEVVMALLCGNTVVHKPASLTPLIALKLQELFKKAGLPPGVLEVVTCPGAVASEMIAMGVSYVSFTGSVVTGQKVSEICGRHMIPCCLELGGKDPTIVCADADIDRAANAVVWGGFMNSGQACASVERVYAVAPIYDRLVAKVSDAAARLRQGDPLSTETDVGAMTDPAQLDTVERLVNDAVKQGARVLAGGKRRKGPGQFFQPTVLVDVTDDMSIMKEEIFGPVVPVIKVETEDEAIRRSNDSEFGLTASVFTKDRQRGRQLAERIDSGSVMINEVLTCYAMPETPWGGVKKSGMGRVHSDEGLRAHCETYHVNYDRIPGLARDPLWYPYSGGMYRALVKGLKLLYRSGLRSKLGALRGR